MNVKLLLNIKMVYPLVKLFGFVVTKFHTTILNPVPRIKWVLGCFLTTIFLSNCNIHQHPLVESNSHYEFKYIPIDTLLVPKASTLDEEPHFIIKNDTTIVYYSKNTNNLIEFNINNGSCVKYSLNIFCEDSNYSNCPELKIFNYINDSIVLLIFDHKSILWVDKAILAFNLKENKLVCYYNFINSGILNSTDFNIDSIINNPKLLTRLNYILEFEQNSPFNIHDSSILLLMMGSNRPYDKINFTNKASIIRVYPISMGIQNKPLHISHCEINSNFNGFSKNGPIGNPFYFTPAYCRINDTNIAIAYKFSHNIISYDLIQNSKNIAQSKPNFINLESYTLPDTNSYDLANHLYYGNVLLYNSTLKYFHRTLFYPNKDSNKNQINNWVNIIYDSLLRPLAIQANDSKPVAIFYNYNNVYFGRTRLGLNYSGKYYGIVRYKLGDFYFVKNSFDLINHQIHLPSDTSLITNYLKQFGSAFENRDTIPILFFRNVCDMCQLKTSTFIKSISSRPDNAKFIFVTPNNDVFKKFLYDYDISPFEAMKIDTFETLLQYINWQGQSGLLIKENEQFTFVGVNQDDLSKVFSKINSDPKVIRRACRTISEH